MFVQKIYNLEKDISLHFEECSKTLQEFKTELPKNLKDIPRIIRNLLNPDQPGNPPIQKYKTYDDAFNQIVNGGKLRKEIAEYIKSRNDRWFLEKNYNEANKE